MPHLEEKIKSTGIKAWTMPTLVELLLSSSLLFL